MKRIASVPAMILFGGRPAIVHRRAALGAKEIARWLRDAIGS